MPVALIDSDQGSGPNGYNSSFSGSPVIDSTGANLIVVALGWVPGTLANPSVVDDDKSNTLSPLTRYAGVFGAASRLWYTAAPSVGSGHHQRTTGTDYFGAGVFSAWSGLAASPFDVENGATQNNGVGNTIQPGSVTPSEDNCLVVTCVTHADNGGQSVVISGGWTIIEASAYVPGTSQGVAFAYQIQTTATPVNPTWDVQLNAPELSAAIAVFKSSGGGGGVVLMPQAVF